MPHYNHHLRFFYTIVFDLVGEFRTLVSMQKMIDGTRPYRGKNFVEPAPSAPAVAETPSTTSDAAPRNLDRRAWFASLVPNLGNGLVEILRASNNLKRDMFEDR